MEIMLFMAIGLGTIAVCVCIGHVGDQLLGIRTVLEMHTELEPVKVKAYQRKHPNGNV